MSAELQHFGLRLHPHEGREQVFELLVDYQPYLPVLSDYEAAFAGRIAGDYQPGLSLKSLIDNSGKVVPFVCTCPDPYCWFITVTVEIIQDINADYVMWHRWRNPFRADKNKASQGLYWNYSGLPPLVFAFDQYQAEIERARMLISQGE